MTLGNVINKCITISPKSMRLEEELMAEILYKIDMKRIWHRWVEQKNKVDIKQYICIIPDVGIAMQW